MNEWLNKNERTYILNKTNIHTHITKKIIFKYKEKYYIKNEMEHHLTYGQVQGIILTKINGVLLSQVSIYYHPWRVFTWLFFAHSTSLFKDS